MLGIFAGRWLATPRPLLDRVAGLFAVGAIGAAAGSAWNWVFPINKKHLDELLRPVHRRPRLSRLCDLPLAHRRSANLGLDSPFVIFGTNPLLAFVGSGILARLIYSLIKVNYHGREVPIQSRCTRSMYASWLPPLNASLLFALTNVAFWFVLLWILHGRG